MFRVEIKKSAEKVFRKFDKSIAHQISNAIFNLSQVDNPELMGIQLSGIHPKTFRIRSGDYRILYRVDFENYTIVIYRIGHRKDIYK